MIDDSYFGSNDNFEMQMRTLYINYYSNNKKRKIKIFKVACHGGEIFDSYFLREQNNEEKNEIVNL